MTTYLTVEQIAASWKIPAKYTSYAEPAPMRLLSNVRVTFDEIR